LTERLTGDQELIINRASLSDPGGLALPSLAPLTAYFFEIQSAKDGSSRGGGQQGKED